jgi:hypothetical protein
MLLAAADCIAGKPNMKQKAKREREKTMYPRMMKMTTQTDDGDDGLDDVASKINRFTGDIRDVINLSHNYINGYSLSF